MTTKVPRMRTVLTRGATSSQAATTAAWTEAPPAKRNGSARRYCNRHSSQVATAAANKAGAARDAQAKRAAEARLKGYEGDACGACGNFTLLRNGTCMKCDTCGGTSGCS